MKGPSASVAKIISLLMAVGLCLPDTSRAQSAEPKLFVITTADTIEELDPETGAVLASFPKPDSVDPGPDGLAYDGQYLYYHSSFGSGTIFEIDPDTGVVVRTFTPTVSCGIDALAHSGTQLYGLCYTEDAVYSIDPATGASALVFQSTQSIIGGMTFGGARGTLFISSGSGVLEVDPQSGTVLGTVNLGVQTYGLGYSNSLGVLFAGSDSGDILAVDPADGTLLYSFAAEGVPFALAADEAAVEEGVHLAIVPSSLGFGVVEVGTSVTRSVRLLNVGSDTLTVSAVEILSGPVTLSGLPPLPLSLPPRQSATFTVELSVDVEGPIAGEIRVTSNDDTDPERLVTVDATGVILTPAEVGTLYGSTGGQDGGRLVTIDPVTGAGNVIADLPGDRFPALAIDSEGRLYVGDPDGTLYQVDAATGLVIRQVETGLDRMAALSFNSNDVLHAVAYDQGLQLFSINSETGATTALVSIQEPINGISFNPLDNVLWAASSDAIFTIDTATGTQRVGDAGLMNITDVQFDLDGTLYATVGGGREVNRLAVIDPSTGSATVVGEIGIPSVSGLGARLGRLEGPHLAVGPQRWDLGYVEVGSAVERTVLIRNIGTDPVTVTALAGIETPFEIVGQPTLPVTLESGESDTVRVQFAPTSEGLFESALTVSSTDVDDPEQTVTFRGEGFVFTYADIGTLYGSTGWNDGGRLITIDPATGAGSVIADLPGPRFPSLAIDSAGRVFAADPDGTVYQVDPGTGVVIRQVETGLGRVAALSFDRLDVLHAVAFDQGMQLFTIDLETGATTALVPIQESINGMSFSPVDEVLWAASTDAIYTIDPVTGEQLVGAAGVINITDLQFDVDGVLYATVGGGREPNRLAIIDPSTGAASVVGEIGIQAVSGLAARLGPLDGAHLAVAPPLWNLGFVDVGSVQERTVLLRNIGTEPVTVTSLAGIEAPFEIVRQPALPVTLGPGESDTVRVQFAPMSEGLFESILTVSSTDVDDPEQTVTFRGEGFVLALAEIGTLYGSTGGLDGGRLIAIDPATGAGTLLGNTAAERLPGLAVDSEGRIFVGDERGRLYLVDAATGQIRKTIRTGLWRFAALSFNASDTLFAFSFDGQTGRPGLYSINVESGSHELVAPVSIDFRGMSFNPIDGSLWAVSDDGIFTFDPVEGAQRVGPAGVPNITDLQFDLDGTLYATAGGGRDPNQLLMIDQATGAATVVGEIGIQSVSGLGARLGRLDGPHIAVGPGTRELGFVEVGSVVERTLLLRNIGTESVTVTALSGIEAPFEIVRQPVLPLTLQPGERDTVQVRFAPTSAGPFESVLTVSSTDADDPERTVTFRGEGFVLGVAEVGVLYGSTGSIDGGRLITIDPGTGAGTLVGNPPVDRLPGLAIDSKGRMYAGDEQGRLHLLDAVTGQIWKTIQTGLWRLPAISFDASDTLYALDRDRVNGVMGLYRIDVETGRHELVTPVSLDFRGMSINPVDGTLWATTNTAVYSVDIATGEATFLTEPWYTPDLQFDLDGNLYVLSGGGQSPAQLLQVDTSTGVTTVIGWTGFESVSGLAARLAVLEGPQLAVNPRTLDFGRLEVGATAARNLILRNVGSAPVTITGITQIAAPFSTSGLEMLPLTLDPGGRDTLTVTVSVETQGLFEAALTFTSDDADEPEKQVAVSVEAVLVNVAQEGVLYGSTGGADGGRLIRIDSATGVGTVLGDPPADRLPALAIDSRGRVFAASPDGRLHFLDAATGGVIRTVNTGLPGLAAMSFNRSDELYAFAFGSQGPALFTVDPETGRHVMVANTDTTFEFRGASFHPFDGGLYASRADPVAVSNTGIYRVDPATGDYTLVGALSTLNVTDIQFDALGDLYATIGGGREVNRLVRINPANWALETVGLIGIPSVSGLAMRLSAQEGRHLAVFPDTIEFGQIATGESRQVDLRLVSAGTIPVTISAVSGPEDPFSIVGVPTLPITLGPGENVTLQVAFQPLEEIEFSSAIVVDSDDEDQPQTTIQVSGKGVKFALDGDLSDASYQTLGSTVRASSFGPEAQLWRILFATREGTLYLGFQAHVQNTPNQFNARPDGIGLLLNTAGEEGAPAGSALGVSRTTDFHFLNANAEGPTPHLSFVADFEVDYMFAAYSDGTPGRLILDAATHVAGKSTPLQRIGATDQLGTVATGPPSDGVFAANTIQFAFQPSTASGDRKGLELAIPMDQLGKASSVIETFAFMVSSTGFFSDNVIPGVVGHRTSLGFEPDFNANQVSPACACSAAGLPIGAGPFHTTLVTGVEEQELPKEYALHQNYPNPFNPSTTIALEVPSTSDVRVSIFDMLGRRVATLVDANLAAGRYELTWNGHASDGSAVASGTYLYRLSAGVVSMSKMMVLVK